MRTLNVDLGDRSYPIYVGGNILAADIIEKHIPSKKVLVVSNTTVMPIFQKQIETALRNFEMASVLLPDGEQFKTLESLNTIYTTLLEKRYDRDCTLIALGGGVVGDITGFAAASYQRGVNFIQIPTTLLAQVDSSVGGKTGVNHALGKNMVGAFYQPRCVIADIASMQTLPERELSAGLAEVIKYGLIRLPGFFEWLEDNIEKLLAKDTDMLSEAIIKSCECKAEIVALDEKEHGIRALLNLGHTFGHAIETFVQYKDWLHGEAVGTGMLMAAEFSQRSGWIDENIVQRIESLLKAAKLPTKPPKGMTAEDFIQLMARDKKVQQGNIRLVLLKAIGDAFISNDFDANKLQIYLSDATQ